MLTYPDSGALEFMGYERSRVTFSVAASSPTVYGLGQSAGDYGVACWCKFQGASALGALDGSKLGVNVDNIPVGYTLIDHCNSTGGYYLGLNAGSLSSHSPGAPYTQPTFIFGNPTFTSDSNVICPWSVWVLVMCFTITATHTRYFLVSCDPNGPNNLRTRVVSPGSVTLTDPGAPLLIGNGPRGAFPGAMQYVCGFSGVGSVAAYQAIYNAMLLAPPPITTTGMQYRIGLMSDADYQPDDMNPYSGRAAGVRFSPQMIFDMSQIASATLQPIKFKTANYVQVQYRGNTAVIIGENVAAGVSGADRVGLGLPSLHVIYNLPNRNTENQSLGVLGALDGRSVLLNVDQSQTAGAASSVYDVGAASAVGLMMKNRVAPGRIGIDLTNWPKEAMALRVTDPVWVINQRFGLSGGRSMRVYQITRSLTTMTCNVSLWG
jgi:hypothetical protein